MSKCLNFYISKFLTIKIILKKEKKLIFNMHLDRLISFVCNEEKKKRKPIIPWINIYFITRTQSFRKQNRTW